MKANMTTLVELKSVYEVSSIRSMSIKALLKALLQLNIKSSCK